MRVGILPRFEKSSHGQGWLVYEQELVDFFSQNGCHVVLLNYTRPIDFESIDLIVFAGGATPGEDQNRDNLEIDVYVEAATRNFPILAICRGAQLIGRYDGNKLVEAENHVDVHRNLRNEQKNLGRCFHKWTFNNLNSNWEVIARDKLDNSIEIFHHRNFKCLGLLSHPERIQNNIHAFARIKELLKI